MCEITLRDFPTLSKNKLKIAISKRINKMNTKNYRIALVGCGVISANHISAILECEGVDIVALCDVKIERAEEKKADFNLDCKTYADYDEMLANESLDAVHISTPHYLHAEMAIKALDLGINVFLEKPMCINREQIDALLAAEKRSTAKICVCFQNRFNEATVKAKEIADEDGGVLSAYGSVFWERKASYYTDSEWRGRYATEGGGVMINQAIHTIDMLCYYLGKPETLVATTANHHLKDVIEVEDTCEGMINFADGKYGNFYATTSFHFQDSTAVFLRTKNHKMEIRQGCLYVDTEKYELKEKKRAVIGKVCYGSGHFALIKKFYEALRTGERMPVTLEDAQWAVRILLAAYRSGDTEVEI